MGSAAWSGITAAAQFQFGLMKRIVQEILAFIKLLFNPLALYDAGAKLIQGLADGVAAKIGAVVDKVKEGLNKIKSLLPGSPIKDGPLVGWNNGGAGKRLMDLVIDGVQSRVPALSSVLDGVTSSLSLDGSGGASVALSAAGGGTGGGATFTFSGTPSTLEGRAIVDALQAYTKVNGPVRIQVAA